MYDTRNLFFKHEGRDLNVYKTPRQLGFCVGASIQMTPLTSRSRIVHLPPFFWLWIVQNVFSCAKHQSCLPSTRNARMSGLLQNHHAITVWFRLPHLYVSKWFQLQYLSRLRRSPAKPLLCGANLRTPFTMSNWKFNLKSIFLLISRDSCLQAESSKICVHCLVRYSSLQHTIVYG